MSSDIKTIAVIIARAGSKGLPGKNLKLLAGKPLIAHSIEQAKASGVCDVVLVSTDDEKIARVAREYGAEVPFLRPPDLATDLIPAEPVMKQALEAYENFTGQHFGIVVYMQPTDVFRTPELIKECVERLKANLELDTVFAAYKTHKNFWRWNVEKDRYERLASDLAEYKARQEREGPGQVILREDAGLVSAKLSSVVRSGRRIGDRVDIVIGDDFRTAIDIHHPFDLWLAEKVISDWDWEQERPSGKAATTLGEDVTSWAQSIRSGYARAFILFALHESGVFETMRREGPKTVEELARIHNLKHRLLDGVLHFLLNSDHILEKLGDKFGLTPRGLTYLFTDQVLTMSYGAIGAYSCLLYYLLPALRGEKTYGIDFERPGDLLARGSFYTGRPNYEWIVSELSQLGAKRIADLGCGACEVLIAFCQLDSTLQAVGVDISRTALIEAKQRTDSAGLSDRIRLVHGDVTHPESFELDMMDVDAFHALMAFHEFLRDGEEAVVEILRKMKKYFPGKYFLLGEFNPYTDEEFQSLPYSQRMHPLFYQHIIHTLTPQGQPIRMDRWLRIFEKAGVKVVSVNDKLSFRLVEYVLRF